MNSSFQGSSCENKRLNTIQITPWDGFFLSSSISTETFLLNLLQCRLDLNVMSQQPITRFAESTENPAISKAKSLAIVEACKAKVLTTPGLKRENV